MCAYYMQSGYRVILKGASYDGKKPKKRRRESSVLTIAQKNYLRYREHQGRSSSARSGIKTLSEQFGRGSAWLLKQ